MSINNFKTDGDLPEWFDNVYDELDGRILDIETKIYPSKILRSLIRYINHLESLANEYPSIKLELDDTKKLWDVARQLIIDKDLKEEFNQRCDEVFKRG